MPTWRDISGFDWFCMGVLFAAIVATWVCHNLFWMAWFWATLCGWYGRAKADGCIKRQNQLLVDARNLIVRYREANQRLLIETMSKRR